LSGVRVGDAAPDFTLPVQSGGSLRLRDLVGTKAIVLYFYPRDHTPGCSTEARAFRDRYETFVAAGAEVIGVSGDSIKSHQRFADRLRLPFILLSDEQGAVRELYGVEKTLGLVPGRVTFVIDRDGIVRHIFSSQLDAELHVREALAALDAIAPPPSRP